MRAQGISIFCALSLEQWHLSLPRVLDVIFMNKNVNENDRYVHLPQKCSEARALPSLSLVERMGLCTKCMHDVNTSYANDFNRPHATSMHTSRKRSGTFELWAEEARGNSKRAQQRRKKRERKKIIAVCLTLHTLILIHIRIWYGGGGSLWVRSIQAIFIKVEILFIIIIEMGRKRKKIEDEENEKKKPQPNGAK